MNLLPVFIMSLALNLILIIVIWSVYNAHKCKCTWEQIEVMDIKDVVI